MWRYFGQLATRLRSVWVRPEKACLPLVPDGDRGAGVVLFLGERMRLRPAADAPYAGGRNACQFGTRVREGAPRGRLDTEATVQRTAAQLGYSLGSGQNKPRLGDGVNHPRGHSGRFILSPARCRSSEFQAICFRDPRRLGIKDFPAGRRQGLRRAIGNALKTALCG